MTKQSSPLAPAPTGRPQANAVLSPCPFSTDILPALAGVLAAWLAAGSTGMLGHSLRHALTWAALLTALVTAWPAIRWRALGDEGGRNEGGLPGAFPDLPALLQPFIPAAWVLAGGLAALILTASTQPAINVAAPAVLLAALALARPQAVSLRVAALAVGVFTLYRMAIGAIPAFWQFTDWLGGGVGWLGSTVAGQPLKVGATFAGLDFLVVMAVVAGVQVALSPRPRYWRGAVVAAALLTGHLLYLVVLAWTPRCLQFLTAPVDGETSTLVTYLRGLSFWKDVLPWNVPVVAAVIHLTLAGLLCRFTPRAETKAGTDRIKLHPYAMTAALAMMALIPPLLTCFYPTGASLEGKKVVAYEKGYLNWEKPKHGFYGRLSIGMYGMMPTYIESLGGTFVKSHDLSEEDLDHADLVILLFPTMDLTDAQLARVHDYVMRGGSLLLLADHSTREMVAHDPFVIRDHSRPNDVLMPTPLITAPPATALAPATAATRPLQPSPGTHMRVGFDTAEFAIGGWLHSYDALANPTTLGITDDRNTIGIVIGASVEARFPSMPVIAGRWGWADPGDPGSGPAMLGHQRYDAGDKLGDILLVAEESLGQGRVLVFGDTSSFVNGISVNSYTYTSRLFAYMAQHHNPAPGLPRQFGALLLVALLAAALLWTKNPRDVLVAGLALAFSLALCVHWSYRAATLLPDGRLKTPNNLALVDGAHQGAYSEESTRPEGTFGIEYNLMRNGFMVNTAPEITEERLRRAALLLTIAPGRSYTSSERRAVRDFVDAGGIFILTVGAERVGPSQGLLDDFGFTIGVPTKADPTAMAPAPAPEDANAALQALTVAVVPRAPETSAAVAAPIARVGVRIPTVPPGAEPTPLGFFKSPYVENGSYKAFVRYWAGWPITCSDPEARVIATAQDGSPMIIVRYVGRGCVMLVGDTEFALNKNLENEDGSLFEGMHENADFWRWLLADLRHQKPWLPSALPPNGSMMGEEGAP